MSNPEEEGGITAWLVVVLGPEDALPATIPRAISSARKVNTTTGPQVYPCFLRGMKRGRVHQPGERRIVHESRRQMIVGKNDRGDLYQKQNY